MRRLHSVIGIAVTVAVILTATGCGGSQLDPAQVRAANEAVAGQGAAAGGSGTTVGTTGSTTGSDDTGTTDGTGPADDAGSSGGSSGTSGDTSGTGSTGSAGGAKPGAAAVGLPRGSCAGFKNQTGITDNTIRIGNSSDISGPVPGLFTSAQQATRAYVAYFNATTNICGRKLALDTFDSRTDAGADQQAYAKICAQDFAGVGSMSAFDSGGAATAQSCGLPDIRTSAVTHERGACSTCFGVQAANASEFENAMPDFFVKNYHAASQKAAFLYLKAGAATQNAATQIAIEKKRGMKFLYTSGIDVSEFNYGPYVQAMKDKGVEWVQFIGAYQNAVRLGQAMQQANFKPQIYVGDPTIYNPGFVKSGGSAVEGAITFVDFVPFEDAGSNKEMQTYLQWLQQVAPGADPTFFGLFAWSATKLFVQQALALGGKLTRKSLLTAVRSVRNWTANGMHAPQPVGPKQNAACWRFLQLRKGHWVPLGGTKYHCNGVSRA